MTGLRRVLYSAFFVRLFQWMLVHMSFALPVDRLRETGTLVAFRHPHPAYPVHVLLVPKRPVASLADLDPAIDAGFLADLVTTVQSLVDELHLPQAGYRLVANGGKYQDFPHLHFHLISDGRPEMTDQG
jgi:histidine triad (HIT) family protein